MKLHEYQSQRILARYGVPIPRGQVATTVSDVRRIAERLGGRVVLKAQVYAGGRGQAGGIRLAEDANQAEMLACQMFGMDIRGYTVSKILVDEAVDIDREFFLGITIDRQLAQPVIMTSTESNIEYAQLAQNSPELVYRVPVHPLLGLQTYQVQQLAANMELNRHETAQFVQIALELYRAFQENDMLLAEINPLVIRPDGAMVSLDAKLVLDDDALFQRFDLGELRDETQETPGERLARQYSIHYVHLQGEVSCLANGAGLAMITLDMLRSKGIYAANFVDFGGGARAERVHTALQLAQADRPRAVLINVFGGLTNCEQVAQGILAAQRTHVLNVPVVVRMDGWNAALARERLVESGLTLADSTVQAVEWIAARIVES